MFASHDPPYLFDGSLHGHLDSSLLPLPQPRPDSSTLIPVPPPALDHDRFSDRARSEHLLRSIPMPAPPSPPPNQPKGPSAANKGMASAAAAAAPRGVYGTRKNSVGESKRMIGGCRWRSTPKKDRHSKINTAQGPRDRRMRLSLDVARRFFDLQDLLGFDRASRTVEWLLTKSRSAIKDLTGCSPSPPPHSDVGDAKVESTSTSECEDVISVSTTDNPTAGKTPDAVQQAIDTLPSCRAKKSAVATRRKVVANIPALARESRVMARARARQRTCRKKMWCRELQDGGPAVQQLSWSSPLQMEGINRRRVHDHMKFLLETEMAAAAALGKQETSSLPQRYTTVQQNSEAPPYSPVVIAGGSGQIQVIFNCTDNFAHDRAGGGNGFAEEQGRNMQTSSNFEDPRLLLVDDDQQHARHREAYYHSSCI